jgi:hypothetical protein
MANERTDTEISAVTLEDFSRQLDEASGRDVKAEEQMWEADSDCEDIVRRAYVTLATADFEELVDCVDKRRLANWLENPADWIDEYRNSATNGAVGEAK